MNIFNLYFKHFECKMLIIQCKSYHVAHVYILERIAICSWNFLLKWQFNYIYNHKIWIKVNKIVPNPSSSLSIAIVSITWHSFKSFESINHLISLKSITYEIVVFKSLQGNVQIFRKTWIWITKIHMWIHKSYSILW
jgi:hypothetical protein